MHGILIVDKPLGPTSFDVVRKLRAALNLKKVGHTGTLDPMATGVLPLCVGEATKIAGYITEGDKAYEATVTLGAETDTQDATGKVLVEREVPKLTSALIESVLSRFRGGFEQIPPMYSAVKQDGQRLYALARKGVTVERKPRRVSVHELTVRDFSANQVQLYVKCSKGFFVRTLAEDIGKALGCGGHLQSLRRTESGPFLLSQAVSFKDALEWATTPEGVQKLRHRLVPLENALSEMPALSVSEKEEEKVLCGWPLEVAGQGQVRVLNSQGKLLAVADIEKGRLKYRRVMVPLQEFS